LITPTTTQQQVKELKDSGILGIGPDLNYYSVEQASESAKALIAGEPYWPEDIISQLPVEIDKPLIVYFRSDWELLLPQDAVTKIQKLPDVDVKFISSWDELAPAIKLEPDQLIFHADVAQKSGHSVDEVITMVKTTVGLILPEKDVPICIGIDTTTTKQQVKEFQKTELLGLVPSISAFGFDESKTAVAKLLTGEPYWPEHIISQLPDVVEYKKPLHVYFRNDWKNYVKTLGLNWDKDVAWESRLCSTWDELGEVLKEEPHQLVFHIHMVTNAGVTIHEFISMIETLLKLVCPHKTIPIAVGIDIDTPMNTIRELQKSNIHGIVPSALDFGITETMHGADALFNRIPYWPKHILDQLPGAPKKIIKNTITLTPRQSQIATLIGDRGLSNKKIAQSLNITESTVKIHVSAILKAYGVRTRTQLAVVANK
jgi:DNA-binding NarL/FixJ family response regulator/DNA-binding Lrp family transcriptional regulator